MRLLYLSVYKFLVRIWNIRFFNFFLTLEKKVQSYSTKLKSWTRVEIILLQHNQNLI